VLLVESDHLGVRSLAVIERDCHLRGADVCCGGWDEDGDDGDGPSAVGAALLAVGEIAAAEDDVGWWSERRCWLRNVVGYAVWNLVGYAVWNVVPAGGNVVGGVGRPVVAAVPVGDAAAG